MHIPWTGGVASIAEEWWSDLTSMLLENDVVGLSLFVVTYYYTDKLGMATGVMFAARILIK